jgi:short subunit dehydrogenase-like uncharacterized protein
MPARRRALLVYGAYGFTGRLLLEQLALRRIPFIVAGRDARRVEEVSALHGARSRVFALDDDDGADTALKGVGVLLNAAGPFVKTIAPCLRACLRNRVHYLDVSGEVGPMEHAAALGEEARSRKVMILPGVGFDVVPSDSLAVHLARRLPGATELTLSVSGSNLLSRGSAKAFAEHAGVPVCVRKQGVLEPLLLRAQMRFVDFGTDVRPTIAVSWGDLVTAFHSTGIPDIEVYFEATAARWLGIGGNQLFGWMTQAPWARAWFRSFAGLVPEGPSVQERGSEKAVVVGEVRARGRRVRARIVTPEAYTFTGIAGAAIVERVLGGAAVPGFQTPASLLGPDFVLSLPGVERQELS